MDSNQYCVVVCALSHSTIREVIVLFSFFNIVPNFVKLFYFAGTYPSKPLHGDMQLYEVIMKKISCDDRTVECVHDTKKIKMKKTVHPFLNSQVVVEPRNDILFHTSL